MPQNVFSSCSPIIVGCYLYTDSGLTIPAPDGEYSDGTDVYTVTGGLGEITSTSLCDSYSTTTTTSTTTILGCNPVTAINVSGTIILGEPSLDVTVFVQNPVATDTLFNVTVVSDYGTNSVSVTILSGNTSGNTVDSIAPSGITNPIISSFCISFVDNNNISCDGYNCIGYVCPCGSPTTTTTTSTTTEPPTTSTTTSTTTPAFETWSVRTENAVVPTQICTEPTINVYSAAGTLFTSGTALFSDSALTTSLVISGANNAFISELLSATVWFYDNGLGQIGSNTGNSC